jgi:hypothetical protein
MLMTRLALLQVCDVTSLYRGNGTALSSMEPSSMSLQQPRPNAFG